MYFDLLVDVWWKILIDWNIIETLVLYLSDLLHLGLKLIFSWFIDRNHFD